MRYLPSVHHLLAWDEASATQPLQSPFHGTQTQKTKSQNTILCHDMQGGYCKAADEDYLQIFQSWELIQSVIYFSHNRISIPPKCWIQACHENGVPCLGTIITEHDSGTSENTLLLDNTEQSIDKLVALCKFYGFDGYLVNIESPFHNPTQDIERFTNFLKNLTLKCKHQLGPQTSILYYDSLNKDGHIQHQNALNQQNIHLFQACDGIFTNYWWDQTHIDISKEFAQNRTSDVFFGIDVFARNVPYSPGPACSLPIKTAHKAGFPVALFAPGWTVECGPSKDLPHQTARLHDKAFWKKLFQ